MTEHPAVVTFSTFFDARWQGIRLADGETVTLDHVEDTDEGWSSVAEQYTYDRSTGVVDCSAYTDGRDCDGRMSTEWHGYALVDELDRMPADEYGPARPKWNQLRRGQRDYSAEAAGY